MFTINFHLISYSTDSGYVYDKLDLTPYSAVAVLRVLGSSARSCYLRDFRIGMRMDGLPVICMVTMPTCFMMAGLELGACYL